MEPSPSFLKRILGTGNKPVQGFITPNEKHVLSWGFTTKRDERRAHVLMRSSEASAGREPVRGFTLVEMIVVLAIITFITSIALLGQSSFNRSIILTDTAYTLAFSVREAQSLGISSRKAGVVQNAGYGVHLSSNQTSYFLFADTSPVMPGDTANPADCPGHTALTGPEAKPGNCMYDSTNEIVKTYQLNNGFKIKSFCGTPASGGAARCSTSPTSPLLALNILYMRPNTQSVITGITSSAFPAPNTSRVRLTDATMRVVSPDGTTERCVYVSQVGQVSVHQPGDPLCP